MDACLHLLLLASLAFFCHAAGKLPNLKLCVVGDPQLKSTRTTKYCDLLAKSKKSPVSCIYAPDRLHCLLAVSRRTADFSVFEAEDLYFSTLWDESSILVVSEIRALKQKPFRYGIVAMVRRDANVTAIGDLKGKRLCHPGFDSGPEWNQLFAQYFEERVAPASCDEHLSLREDRIKTTSAFFGSACKAGPWSPSPAEDVRLKQQYWNLCSLCEGGDCGNADKHRGSGGSIICFKDGVGDVLWARYEDVKADIQFLQSGWSNPASEYYYLCDNGTLMSSTSEEPCFWLAKPWQVVGASRKSASGVQKMLDAISDDDLVVDWKENFLHVVELYLEYIHNLMVSRTPEDYLRRVPGYLSASAMSQSNCKPRHSVIMCVASAIEGQKCDWMSKAGSALGIQPSLECVQKANFTACLDSVEKGETDVVIVAPDFLYEATVKHNLKTFLLESGNEYKDNYLSSVVVNKKSPTKKLSDLKGKKLCLTKKNGIGWWTALAALHRESITDSLCADLSHHFQEVCVLSDHEDGLKRCCPEKSLGRDETDLLLCLQEDGCDAAILDLNTLTESLGGRNSPSLSKDLRLSDFRTLCSSAERPSNCHWTWSHPNYLMSHAGATSGKADEIFGLFFQLGEYFGRNSRKSNDMLEIFAPFHEVRNVLFRDTSTSFVTLDKWNQTNSYPNVVERAMFCSKAPGRSLSLFTLLMLFVLGFSGSPLLKFIQD